jgi:type III secretory pathway component EscR
MTHARTGDNDAAHSHSHAPQITNLNKAFIIGIASNLAYVIIQIIIGLQIN